MITGQVVGHGTAITAGGMRVGYRLIIPAKTPANMGVIATEAKRWRAAVERYQRLAIAGRLSGPVARRALFVEECLAHAGETLRTGKCCLIVAQDDTGRILGLTEYTVVGPIAYLNLQAIDPEQLPGSPGAGQLRGIGTGLLAAASRDFLARNVQTVYVHPLDAEATKWWTQRGLGVCEGGSLCIRGRVGIEALKGVCEVRPDCPDLADCLVCGTRDQTEAMRLPARRA